ncbi:unnamed protein product [Xylocopa violacea]|uniref:Secreted protein n=1 Tax=Xylocopa violacea TaxID=135666 RepID=A0ABP1NFH0_XYLVO
MRLEFFVLWIAVCWASVASYGSAQLSGNRSVERSKREFEGKYLVFPEGSNVQLVYCTTITTYSKPSGMFTIGMTAGQAWELPSESMLSNKFRDYHRRSRRELYRKLELLLGSRGKDGRACILKMVCDAAGRDRGDIGKGSFFEEILHAVFTLPTSTDDTDAITEYERAYLLKENCNEARLKCPDAF